MAGTLDPPWPKNMAGGSLAPEFANTLDWRGREQPVETMTEFRHLLRLGLGTSVLTAAEARSLLTWSERHASLAQRALERALEVREDIAALLTTLVRNVAPEAAVLARLEATCRQAWGARRLVATTQGARWEWAGALDPDRVAAAAALDMERLLVDPERPPIRICEGDGCGWFFLDTSRNRRRRWCSMESCGNRAKARRFYHRSRSTRTR
jgi:predicted RNA-binding Zn ribbon-like protein